MTSLIRPQACAALALSASLMLSGSALARTVMVGGAPMYPTKTIVENAVNSKDHTTLVAAVKAAGLVDTLASPGPFTVFAPTNGAFSKLPTGTVDNLVQPQNKGTLTKVLTYHVVAGNYSAQYLMRKVKQGGGRTTLKTVQGEPLTVLPGKSGKSLFVEDAKGNTARVTISNVMQSNGVIHVVDAVLMP
jgi:uncharacterized surface protein with fasciclin (FAS1) repeats